MADINNNIIIFVFTTVLLLSDLVVINCYRFGFGKDAGFGTKTRRIRESQYMTPVQRYMMMKRMQSNSGSGSVDSSSNEVSNERKNAHGSQGGTHIQQNNHNSGGSAGNINLDNTSNKGAGNTHSKNQQTNTRNLSPSERYRLSQANNRGTSNDVNNAGSDRNTKKDNNVNQGGNKANTNNQQTDTHNLSPSERYKLSQANNRGTSNDVNNAGSDRNTNKGNNVNQGGNKANTNNQQTDTHNLSPSERYKLSQANNRGTSNDVNNAGSDRNTKKDNNVNQGGNKANTNNQQTDTHNLSPSERYKLSQANNRGTSNDVHNAGNDRTTNKGNIVLGGYTNNQYQSADDGLGLSAIERYRRLKHGNNAKPPGSVCLDCIRKDDDPGNNRQQNIDSVGRMGGINTQDNTDKVNDRIQDNIPRDKRITTPNEVVTVGTLEGAANSNDSDYYYDDKSNDMTHNSCNPNPCRNGGVCMSDRPLLGDYECDCPINFGGKHCQEDRAEKAKQLVKEKIIEHGTEKVLGIIIPVVVVVLFSFCHCQRVSSRRSLMKKKFEKASRKGKHVDPIPGWCTVSSHVLQVTFCCKNDTIVENYLPPKKEPKQKKAHKKKKKSESAVSSDQIDDEISKRLNSRTSLGPNMNQSNQSENNSLDWKTSYDLKSPPVYKMLRKHRLARLSSKYQQIYTDDESQSSESSWNYHQQKQKRMRKKKKVKNITTIDKEPMRNRPNNRHPEVRNKVRDYNFRQDEDAYTDGRKKSHVKAASGEKKRNTRMKSPYCERYDHFQVPAYDNGKRDTSHNDGNWLMEENMPVLYSSYNGDNRLGPQWNMKRIGIKKQNLRNYLEDRYALVGLSYHQQENVHNSREENISGNKYRPLSVHNDNSEHGYKTTTDKYDNEQREIECGRFQNRNFNTNIEEQSFRAQSIQPCNLYPKQCDSSDNDMCHLNEYQPFYNYFEYPEGRQYRYGIPYSNLKINKSVEETQEPKSEHVDCKREAKTSDIECRQFYEVPDRELYGVWSTTIDIQQNDPVINPKETTERHAEIEPIMQELNTKSQTNELGTTTDSRQYLKSFEQDGQTLFYVESDLNCAQLNCNQNHELKKNDTHAMSSKQVDIHEADAVYVNNEDLFSLGSPIVTDSNSDISDDVVSDNVSTLVASATGSEMYTSNDNTLVALSDS